MGAHLGRDDQRAEGNVEGVAVAGRKLLVTTLENVSSRLRIYEPSGQLVREVALPTLGSAGGDGM
jgi:prolyl oligopeptidase